MPHSSLRHETAVMKCVLQLLELPPGDAHLLSFKSPIVPFQNLPFFQIFEFSATSFLFRIINRGLTIAYLTLLGRSQNTLDTTSTMPSIGDCCSTSAIVRKLFACPPTVPARSKNLSHALPHLMISYFHTCLSSVCCAFPFLLHKLPLFPQAQFHVCLSNFRLTHENAPREDRSKREFKDTRKWCVKQWTILKNLRGKMEEEVRKKYRAEKKIDISLKSGVKIAGPESTHDSGNTACNGANVRNGARDHRRALPAPSLAEALATVSVKSQCQKHVPRIFLPNRAESRNPPL